MTDSARHPTLLLRASSVLARCLLWLVLLAWLAFTVVWGGLHGFIVPRIEDYRPRIESEASRLLGVPVRIGAISAQTIGLVPSFELSQVTLLDSDGRVALTLPYVSVALSPRSLINRGFDQLYIDRPELEVRRTVEGKILIAGLDFSAAGSSDSRARDWFFSQAEIVIQGGKLRWIDEQRQAPTLELSDVSFLARNSTLRHGMRLDATPPAAWGERFSLRASFRESLLAVKSRVWDDWDGVVYAGFDHVDVSQLRRYAELGMEVSEGSGAVRLWADWSRGRLGSIAADLALDQVSVKLAPDLQPLVLRSVAGRLSGRRLDDGLEFSTQDLAFLTDEGLQWPAGNLSIKYQKAAGREAKGELRADQLDLHVLSRIAGRLPIGEEAHHAIKRHEPRGLVESFQVLWQGGTLTQAVRYDLRGRIKGLELASRPAPTATAGGVEPIGVPGLRGMSVDFEANQSGGKAKIAVQDGALMFPGIFDDPTLLFDRLLADAQWKFDGRKISVEIPQLKFSNADGEGEVQANWQTGSVSRGGADPRFPGVLDLRATLNRVEGNRVHRYLPKEIDMEARDYVRHAVKGGRASAVNVRVRGDLYDLPFADARQGEFRIAGNVADATFAYVPESFISDPKQRWPALTQLAGELVFDRQSLQIKVAQGRVGGKPGLQLGRVQALIADLTKDPVVAVSGEVRGPLSEMLAVVAETPVAVWTGRALDKAQASGAADLKLQLNLPIFALENSKVTGSVVLPGNDVQILPDTPLLARTRGTVNFSEQGVSLSGVLARAYGGEVRLEGGSLTTAMNPVAGGPVQNETVFLLRAQGTAQAEALRRASELGFAAQLARHLSGSAAYGMSLSLGRGPPEISINSNLKGMAINLPPPFRKGAETTLNLRYENTATRPGALTPGQRVTGPLEDRLLVELAGLASIQYQRDVSGATAKVLRGSILLGGVAGEPVKLPDQGVVASARLDQMDVSAWAALLNPKAGPASKAVQDATGAASRKPGVPEEFGLAQARAYLPRAWSLQAREISYEGRSLRDFTARGNWDDPAWRANVEARELSGYFEFKQGGAANAGTLFARLSRLSLTSTEATQVESLLDTQPQDIPALDVVVEDFELRGKKLGRLEIQAVNRGGEAGSVAEGALGHAGPREWRLQKLNILMPEASFTATGNWAAVGAQAPGAPAPAASAVARGARAAAAPARAQRTVMNFKLDVADSGALLARFGMKDVVRRGKGKLEGQVAWLGTPVQMDYPSLRGQFNVGFEAGQFLKADPGIAKLLAVLSLQSLPRRLALDFRDVFSEGFAFDFVRGDVRIEQGVAITNNLQMKGVSAAVLMDGRADIASETQDITVVVVPEIDAGTLSLVATAINPAIGIGSFLAQLFLRRPLIQASTQEFHIDGSWADPRVTRQERNPASASTTDGATPDRK